MDPLTAFPPEVCDSILQHLSGNEILDASTVSKTWYTVIGASTKSMQKIKLNLSWLDCGKWANDDIARILIDSHRKYQNVAMKYQCKHIHDFYCILKANKRQWKCVQIENLVFESLEDFLQMTKTFRRSVEVLIVCGVYIRNTSNLPAIAFPKLRVLKLIDIDVHNGCFYGIFTNCGMLEKLVINANDYTRKIAPQVKVILEKNNRLKYLKTTPKIIYEISQQNMSYGFKLDTFGTLQCCEHGSSLDLKPFLRNQFENLKDIFLDQTKSPDSVKLMLQMPNLRNLNLGLIDSGRSFIMDTLNVNKTVEKLSFWDMKKRFDIMKCLVDAVPNLRKVHMYSLTQAMMEHLSVTAKHLEVLKLRTIEATDMSSRNLFPKLRKVQVDILSDAADDYVASIPVDEANSLVKLLKDSKYIVLH